MLGCIHSHPGPQVGHPCMGSASPCFSDLISCHCLALYSGTWSAGYSSSTPSTFLPQSCSSCSFLCLNVLPPSSRYPHCLLPTPFSSLIKCHFLSAVFLIIRLKSTATAHPPFPVLPTSLLYFSS